MRLNKNKISSPNKNELISLVYTSSKQWNIANYEKLRYKALGFTYFLNWVYQNLDRFPLMDDSLGTMGDTTMLNNYLRRNIN